MYANFTIADEVREFLKSFKDTEAELRVRGTTLRVVQARTKLRKARNWPLRKAQELVQAAAGDESNAVLDWKERTVTVDVLRRLDPLGFTCIVAVTVFSLSV